MWLASSAKARRSSLSRRRDCSASSVPSDSSACQAADGERGDARQQTLGPRRRSAAAHRATTPTPCRSSGHAGGTARAAPPRSRGCRGPMSGKYCSGCAKSCARPVSSTTPRTDSPRAASPPPAYGRHCAGDRRPRKARAVGAQQADAGRTYAQQLERDLGDRLEDGARRLGEVPREPQQAPWHSCAMVGRAWRASAELRCAQHCFEGNGRLRGDLIGHRPWAISKWFPANQRCAGPSWRSR